MVSLAVQGNTMGDYNLQCTMIRGRILIDEIKESTSWSTTPIFMESQWGYNLQCNVVNNLLITFTTIPLQYEWPPPPPKKKKSRNVWVHELFEGGRTTCNVLGDPNSSKGGVQLAMYWVIRGRILVDRKKEGISVLIINPRGYNLQCKVIRGWILVDETA